MADILSPEEIDARLAVVDDEGEVSLDGEAENLFFFC